MSLGIFSFDLAALLRSLDEYFSAPDDAAAAGEIPAEAVEDASPPASDVAMARVFDTAVTPVVVGAAAFVSPAIARTPPPPMTREELERQIRELATRVVHNYRDADVAADNFALRLAADRGRVGPAPDKDDDAALRARREGARRDDARREELRRTGRTKGWWS